MKIDTMNVAKTNTGMDGATTVGSSLLTTLSHYRLIPLRSIQFDSESI